MNIGGQVGLSERKDSFAYVTCASPSFAEISRGFSGEDPANTRLPLAIADNSRNTHNKPKEDYL